MRALTVFLLIASVAQADLATERKSIFKLENGSGHGTGFIVEGNLLLTAIHVADMLGDTTDVGGVRAELIHKEPMNPQAGLNDATRDGVAIYKLDGGPYKSLKVAEKPADAGSTCRLLGYPARAFSVLEAKLRPGSKYYNILQAEAVPGNSGGPCLGPDGKVIGLVTHSSPGSSLIVGTAVLKRSIEKVKKGKQEGEKPRLVIFSADFCPPCQQNKRSISGLKRVETSGGYVYSGTYKGEQVTIVEMERGEWSDSSMVEKYSKETGDDITAFPTYWVPGSRKAKIGGLIGGVIDWAKGTIASVIKTLIGKQYVRDPQPLNPMPHVPEVSPESENVVPAPPAEEEAPAPSLADRIKEHVSKVAKEQAEVIKAEVDRKLKERLGETKLELAKDAAQAALEAKKNGESNRNSLLAALASLVAAYGAKQSFVKRFAAKRIADKIESLKEQA